MLIIQDILISNDIIEEHFLCNLNACKGACCWEGDFGAPLEASELPILEKIFELIKPYLSQDGLAAIEQQGLYTYFEEAKGYGTPLIDGGACAYLTYNEMGIALCGIEQAYYDGATTFKKPISCHLYPIRVSKSKAFHALNYDRWDICSAACTEGRKQKMPLYKFAKEALTRKYGPAFYEELEEAAAFMNNSE